MILIMNEALRYPGSPLILSSIIKPALILGLYHEGRAAPRPNPCSTSSFPGMCAGHDKGRDRKDDIGSPTAQLLRTSNVAWGRPLELHRLCILLHIRTTGPRILGAMKPTDWG